MAILHTINTFLIYTVVYALAFEDVLYVFGDNSNEMIEQGKIQYQLLKERGNLPQYGKCWKAAIEHINEGCRHLSEDTQSDIALHITNCFLEMSGHETYNCEQDKKPNLRGICINSMSDRAFNVYTEFYTHTQNICWFLRGQIWHETISENTFKVGKQLEQSTHNQEVLLQAQKESLQVQEQILKHGKFLENVLEDLYISTKAHQEILRVMTSHVANLQAWVVGEISWLDSIVFYVAVIFFIFVVTSTNKTASCRLSLLFLTLLNFIIERVLSSFLINFSPDLVATDVLYGNIQFYVWGVRYLFLFLGVMYLIVNVYNYQDLLVKNNKLLSDIYKQNQGILEILDLIKNSFIPNSNIGSSEHKMDVINENGRKTLEFKLNNLKECINNNVGIKNLTTNRENFDSPLLTYTRFSPSANSSINTTINSNVGDDTAKENRLKGLAPRRKFFPLTELHNNKYNLRSRQGTPDSVK